MTSHRVDQRAAASAPARQLPFQGSPPTPRDNPNSMEMQTSEGLLEHNPSDLKTLRCDASSYNPGEPTVRTSARTTDLVGSRCQTGQSLPLHHAPAREGPPVLADEFAKISHLENSPSAQRAITAGTMIQQVLLQRRPSLSIEAILEWADEHRRCTGEWPKVMTLERPSLPPGESWKAINEALRLGHRGLPGGDSLPRLLARERGARNHRGLPQLTEERILQWARAHHRRTGRWPSARAGVVCGSAEEVWGNIDAALRQGTRGLPGGETLLELLARRLGVYPGAVRRLTEQTILAWADAHQAATGSWPCVKSGPVVAEPEESWAAINDALRQGLRGLPGGDSLPRLLVRHRRLTKLWQRRGS
jgi:hypothetical protein